ncbi:hypothetical protein DPEC_G00304730 [Dallia pectoralis]|uniref:Uncharacterized protein n=1 Tax=Dallia pectoralis TaxID=75939 RepID=A0ACC2FDN6_DALPE|nr:hypothetical protein DPEC_G00304730 [Dallia pectoralis]
MDPQPTGSTGCCSGSDWHVVLYRGPHRADVLKSSRGLCPWPRGSPTVPPTPQSFGRRPLDTFTVFRALVDILFPNRTEGTGIKEQLDSKMRDGVIWVI